jgi:hypothetical protein
MAAALSLSQAAGAPASGQDGGGPAPGKPASSADAGAVDRLSLAARLAEAGRAASSPLALAAAAELYASTGTRDRDLPKTSEGGEAPAEGAVVAPAPETDPAALYAEAAALARNASNEALALQIESQAGALASRQPVPGSGGRHRDRVSPYGTDVYSVRYRGGEPARATAIADGSFDIDLYVYGPSGNLVDYDNDATSIGICAWTPGRTSDHTLRVKNTTGSFVNYLVYTN